MLSTKKGISMPSAKKTKAKSSRRKIDFNSPKTRMLLIIAVFAAIGGGMLVYRTFAARGYWTYTIADKTLQAGTGSTPVRGVGAKKDMSVMNIAPKGKMTVSVPGTIYPAIPKGQQVRFCLHIDNPANPANPGQSIVVNQTAENGRVKTYPVFSAPEVEKVADNYKKTCTIQRTWTGDTLVGPITVTNNGTTPVNVSVAAILFREKGDPNTSRNQ